MDCLILDELEDDYSLEDDDNSLYEGLDSDEECSTLSILVKVVVRVMLLV